MSTQGCPVCDRADAKLDPFDGQARYLFGNDVDCPACGQFVVTRWDDVSLRNSRGIGWDPYQVSALLRERSIGPLAKFWLQDGTNLAGPLEHTDATPIDVKELVTRWPRTVPERIDRTLCNMAKLSPVAGYEVDISTHETALAFAQTPHEAQFTFKTLVECGCLKNTMVSPVRYVVTQAGWARYDELTRGASRPDNPVFVAMWFGDDASRSKMLEVYQHIEQATDKAGYRALRVDLQEHNEWIMDRVLGDIRLAPFVVADFSKHRNGVYFEAAFARGLGIPVIHTCPKEDFRETHFDTVQLNHVIWDTPEDLQEKLYRRILGTVGQGPHRPRSGANHGGE